MRKNIFNINIISQVMRSRNAMEIEIMTFLRLAEHHVHRSKIGVDSRKDILDKALRKLHAEGLVGKRINMFSLTKKGNRYLDDLLHEIIEIKKSIENAD